MEPWDTRNRRPGRPSARSYTYRRNRGQRGFGLAVTGIILWFLFIIGLNVAVALVALHFILKYW